MNPKPPCVSVGSRVGDLATQALRAVDNYLETSGLSASTVRAYRRQCATYVEWIVGNAAKHPNAFANSAGAEAAVAAWRRRLARTGAAPATIQQALLAMRLLYKQGAHLQIQLKPAPRRRTGRRAVTEVLSLEQQEEVDRASLQRGARDAALIAVMLYAGATPEECEHLNVKDVTLAATAGRVRLRGSDGDVRLVPLPEVATKCLSAWIATFDQAGPLWVSKRASPPWRGGGRQPMTTAGITRIVGLVGEEAGIPGLRPYHLRHTYAVRLREEGADITLVQERLGLRSTKAASRYFVAKVTRR
jgi:site-specific recombinase XerD